VQYLATLALIKVRHGSRDYQLVTMYCRQYGSIFFKWVRI